MLLNPKDRVQAGRKLMEDFAERTGLSDGGDHRSERYLWTDAFAVQTFFGLAHISGKDVYRALALKLIGEVHQKLGRFHPMDLRKGWISGLPEEEGGKHPTAGGLRIGKKLPERRHDEPFNDRLEWERDGQYFHYLTRWMQALLQSEEETREKRYAVWAAELLQAGAKFIHKSGSQVRMYWKMSTDLSRPLVKSMGAHDPMEGLIYALTILERVPEKASQLQPIIKDLTDCCQGLDWSTTDPLGLGGLLLNIARLADLHVKNVDVPACIRPKKVFTDSLHGLEAYRQIYNRHLHARQRLAFRECGLSLGLRVLMGFKEKALKADLNVDKLNEFVFLADEIEEFWMNPQNQNSLTWTEHLNINAVTLAASLVAV
jgi:hypothetical protein